MVDSPFYISHKEWKLNGLIASSHERIYLLQPSWFCQTIPEIDATPRICVSMFLALHARKEVSLMMFAFGRRWVSTGMRVPHSCTRRFDDNLPGRSNMHGENSLFSVIICSPVIWFLKSHSFSKTGASMVEMSFAFNFEKGGIWRCFVL